MKLLCLLVQFGCCLFGAAFSRYQMSVDALSTGTTHQYHHQHYRQPATQPVTALLQQQSSPSSQHHHHSTTTGGAASTTTQQSFYNNINSITRKSAAIQHEANAAAPIISSAVTYTAAAALPSVVLVSDSGLKQNKPPPPLTSSSQRLNTAGNAAALDESSLPVSRQNTLKRQILHQNQQQEVPACRKLTSQEAAALQNSARATAGFIIQRPVSPPIGGSGNLVEGAGVDTRNKTLSDPALGGRLQESSASFIHNRAGVAAFGDCANSAKGKRGLGRDREGSLRKVGKTAAAAVVTQKAAAATQQVAHNSMPSGAAPPDPHTANPADLSTRMILASSNPSILPPIARDGQISK